MERRTEDLRKCLDNKGMGVDLAAERIGIDRATFYRKLKKGASGFTVGEILKMVSTDVLSREEAIQIFLT